MKALVFHGDNDLRYEEVPIPKMGEDEALVKVRAVGICGPMSTAISARQAGGLLR